MYRSFRRGATMQAGEAKVPRDIIEVNNRWSKVERKSGGMPRMSMAALYTEIKQALATKLVFLSHFRLDRAIAQELDSNLVNKVILGLF